MINNKRILAVVPARGGSKGVKHKNIHPLSKKPLITHTAELISQLSYLDRAIVSTDDKKIAEVAAASGLNAPFFRPDHLSGDRIGDYDVLLHALTEMEEQDKCQYDYVIMLQPTCPLRTTEHVTETIQKAVDGEWDSVWTISPSDLKYHPLKALAVAEDGSMDFFDERGKEIIARQQLTPVYHRNGAAYAISRSCILDQQTIKGERSAAVIIDDVILSIDTLDDFSKCESALKIGS